MLLSMEYRQHIENLVLGQESLIESAGVRGMYNQEGGKDFLNPLQRHS